MEKILITFTIDLLYSTLEIDYFIHSYNEMFRMSEAEKLNINQSYDKADDYKKMSPMNLTRCFRFHFTGTLIGGILVTFGMT